MRAEVALLRRVIFRVDEDRVVGTGGDAGLAADADVLVEIDDAIGAAVHGRGWTSGDTGRVIALVAAGDLKGAAGGGELSDVDVLDVSAIHAERNGILRLTSSAAGVTADAAGLVDDLSPLHRFGHRAERITSGSEAGSRSSAIRACSCGVGCGRRSSYHWPGREDRSRDRHRSIRQAAILPRCARRPDATATFARHKSVR